jgi:hypothetical protein
MAIAVGGGYLAVRLTGSLTWLFAALALGLLVQGTSVLAAIVSGAWFSREDRFKRSNASAAKH